MNLLNLIFFPVYLSNSLVGENFFLLLKIDVDSMLGRREIAKNSPCEIDNLCHYIETGRGIRDNHQNSRSILD